MGWLKSQQCLEAVRGHLFVALLALSFAGADIVLQPRGSETRNRMLAQPFRILS